LTRQGEDVYSVEAFYCYNRSGVVQVFKS